MTFFDRRFKWSDTANVRLEWDRINYWALAMRKPQPTPTGNKPA